MAALQSFSFLQLYSPTGGFFVARRDVIRPKMKEKTKKSPSLVKQARALPQRGYPCDI
jgi:hypothetical protein